MGDTQQPEKQLTDSNNEFEELINDIPENVKEEIIESITAIRSTQQMSIPPEALIMTKINENHISEFLAASKENMQNSFVEKKEKQNLHEIFDSHCNDFCYFNNSFIKKPTRGNGKNNLHHSWISWWCGWRLRSWKS